MGTESTHNGAAANGSKSQSVRITANYSDYKPPFGVEPVIRRMLDSVPEKYLIGLSEVVLTNTSALSRSRRRSVTKSRKRKVRQASALGLYHPEWKGKQAWIEIFVDNTLRWWGNGLWLHIPFIRESTLGDVLFHEIGHHIHYTARPEYREKEDVADVWKARLDRSYYRTRFPVLRILMRVVRLFLGSRWKSLYSRMAQNQLRNKRISRAEYEERTKTRT